MEPSIPVVPNLFRLDRADGSCHICDGPGGWKVTAALAMQPELLTPENQNHISVTLSLFSSNKLGVMCVTDRFSLFLPSSQLQSLSWFWYPQPSTCLRPTGWRPIQVSTAYPGLTYGGSRLRRVFQTSPQQCFPAPPERS